MLNDYVARRHRAKWNSLESLNNFSWSGSAMLGGVIVDKFGYRCDAQQRQPHHQHHIIVYDDARRRRCTFLITAGLQTLSFLLLAPSCTTPVLIHGSWVILSKCCLATLLLLGLSFTVLPRTKFP